MSNKRKAQNKPMPARWRWKNGAWRYRVPPGLEHLWDGKKEFRLGATMSEAYKTWSDRVGDERELRTMAELFDRFSHSVVPTKAPKTRDSYLPALQRLRPVFGHMTPEQIKPRHVYAYVDARTDSQGRGRVAAHREIEVLSAVLTQAVRWGVIDRHPFKGEVRLSGEKARTRDVEPWELAAALELSPGRGRGIRVAQAYLQIKILTGLRRADMLRLVPIKAGDDAITFRANKTGKPGKILLTDALRAAVLAAMDARPMDISPWLFCTRDGLCYYDEATGKSNGWDSLWDRFMTRLIDHTEVTERFGDRDLRAVAGRDAENLEHARQLLQHSSSATTEKHYRRGVQVVKPTR